MKNGAPCPKCTNSEVLFLPRVTDLQQSSIAAYVSDEEWRSGGNLKVEGVFVAYVCRACGFTEFYAHEPERIPVRKIPGAKLSRARPPYR